MTVSLRISADHTHARPAIEDGHETPKAAAEPVLRLSAGLPSTIVTPARTHPKPRRDGASQRKDRRADAATEPGPTHLEVLRCGPPQHAACQHKLTNPTAIADRNFDQGTGRTPHPRAAPDDRPARRSCDDRAGGIDPLAVVRRKDTAPLGTPRKIRPLEGSRARRAGQRARFDPERRCVGRRWGSSTTPTRSRHRAEGAAPDSAPSTAKGLSTAMNERRLSGANRHRRGADRRERILHPRPDTPDGRRTSRTGRRAPEYGRSRRGPRCQPVARPSPRGASRRPRSVTRRRRHAPSRARDHAASGTNERRLAVPAWRCGSVRSHVLDPWRKTNQDLYWIRQVCGP